MPEPTSCHPPLSTKAIKSTQPPKPLTNGHTTHHPSTPTFSSPPTPLGTLFTTSGSHHAALLPLTPTLSLIHLSGQPGFIPTNGSLNAPKPTTPFASEVHACFDNIETALNHVAPGCGGLEVVYKFTAFLTDVRRDEATMMEVWRERGKGRRVVWVTVGVKELAVEGMRVEIAAEGCVVRRE